MSVEGCTIVPHIFDCSIGLAKLNPIVGIILTIPIMYLAIIYIRKYFETQDKSTRKIASFYILTAISQIPSISCRFLPQNIADSHVESFMYDFQIFCQIFSYILICEQASLILINLRHICSKVFSQIVKYLSYILLASIVFFAIIVPFNFYPGKDGCYDKKLDIYLTYFVPYVLTCDIIVGSVFLIITTVAFVFSPGLTEICNKKLVTTMRVLTFFIAFFFVLWVITYKSRNDAVDIIMVASVKDVKLGMVLTFLLDLFCWYVPSLIFGTLMVFITRDDLANDPDEEDAIVEATKSMFDSFSFDP